MKRSDTWLRQDFGRIPPRFPRRLRLQKSEYAHTLLNQLSVAYKLSQDLANRNVNYTDDFLNYLANLLNNWFAYEADFVVPANMSVIYLLMSRGLLNIPTEYAIKVAQSILDEEREFSDGFELE